MQRVDVIKEGASSCRVPRLAKEYEENDNSDEVSKKSALYLDLLPLNQMFFGRYVTC